VGFEVLVAMTEDYCLLVCDGVYLVNSILGESSAFNLVALRTLKILYFGFVYFFNSL